MKTTHRTRMPTTLEAFSPIIVMLLLLGLGYALFDLPAEPLMIISTVFAGFLVIKLGHCYLDILDAISEKIAKTMPALLILITVGFSVKTSSVKVTPKLLSTKAINSTKSKESNHKSNSR